MNEKQRDQLIRETLDQCLSGIDTMPSMRPMVAKQLEEGPKAKKRISLRRFAVPAVALALCVCLFVTGTQLGMIRWPDRIRTPEVPATVAPVALAQPEGEGGDVTPSPDAQASEDSGTRKFCSLLEGKTRLNAVCEKAGIRFEVHTAEVTENGARVLLSFRDTEGNLDAGSLEHAPYFKQDIGTPSLTAYIGYGSVPEENRIWYYLEFMYDGIDDRSDRMVTISAENLPLRPEEGKEPEYIRETWTVEVPLASILKDSGEYPEKYSGEYFATRLEYELNEDGTATVTGALHDSTYYWNRLLIPAELDGHPVTAVAGDAFSGYRLESVILPEGLQSIGDHAFRNVPLRTAEIPDSVTSIADNAFDSSHSLIIKAPEGSCAHRYCAEHDIAFIAVPGGNSAAWDEWGATPIPLVSEIAIQASDEDSAAWVDWGTTPVPGADSVSWDEWGSVPETTPMPAIEDEYDARTMDVYSALDKFVTAWEKRDLGTMRNMFVYDYDKWEKPEDAERLPNIVSLALMNGISPTNGDFIEDALDLKIPDDGSGVTVSVRITDVARQAKYRFRIRMVRQPDESWRIDAGSFESFEELEYIGKTVIATRDLPHLTAMAECPEIAGSLRPVNAVVFDAKGSSVRFLVHSVAVRDEDVWFIFGVQDPDGILGDNYLADPFVFGEPADAVASYEYPVGLYDDHESHTCWYLYHVTYDRAAFPAGGEIGFGMDNIRILRTNAIDLMPYVREYGSQCSLIDLPEIHMWLYQDGKWQEYFNRQDYQLLDYTRRLDVALTAHEQLTGIGWKDGMLRIQFHSLDDMVTDETGYTYGAVYGRMFICKTANGFYDYDYQALEWAMEEDKGVVAWTEYQVPCTEADLDNMKLVLEFDEIPEVVHGQWRLLLRSDDVLVSATPVPGPEPTPMPEMEPTPVPEISGTAASVSRAPWSALEQSIKDSFPGIMEGLVPVGEYCERGGLRFTVHAAAAYDDVTYMICSVQNLSRNTAAEGVAFGDSPEWLQDIAAPSASQVIHFGTVEGEFASWYMVNFTYDGVVDPEDRTVTIGINHIPEVSETGETVAWRETLLSAEIPLSSIWKETGKLPAKYSEEYFAARLKYIVNEDGTAAIISRGNPAESYWSELVIPAEMNGRPVTAITDGAFADHLNLESVTLPDSVTSIGAKAFSGCYRLSSVNFPENLVSIGDEAFWSANLTYPVLPASLEFIGENAFQYNHSLNCIVPEDSFALQYCEENGLPYIMVSAAASGTDEPAQPAAVFQPGESPKTVSGQALSTLESVRPGLKDRLFPVNLYWTDGTVRLDVISAAVGETESWVIYSLTNADFSFFGYLNGSLDDSPVSEETTEHYELYMVPSDNTTYYAARIRHSQPDPERKTAVLNLSDINITEHSAFQDMKSILLNFESDSGDLIDLPDLPHPGEIIIESGESVTPDDFRESGKKILDYTHSPDLLLSNGLELSGIRLEDGMLHVQLHTVEPYPTDENGWPWLRFWYLDYDARVADRKVCRVTWQDPAEKAGYTYTEYIIPWTMEDFDKYDMSIQLFEAVDEIKGPLSFEIPRPE